MSLASGSSCAQLKCKLSLFYGSSPSALQLSLLLSLLLSLSLLILLPRSRAEQTLSHGLVLDAQLVPCPFHVAFAFASPTISDPPKFLSPLWASSAFPLRRKKARTMSPINSKLICEAARAEEKSCFASSQREFVFFFFFVTQAARLFI